MKRWAVLVLAMAAGVAGCGDSDGAVTTHTHAAGDAAHVHSTETPIEVLGPAVPTVNVTVTPDPVAGFNLHASVTNLTWAPEQAGLSHIEGEGHAHVYVDGVKVARIYGEWYHLSWLEPGTHEVTVSLNANTHAPYAVDGVEIADSVTVESD
ncbi:MAG: hypothetical protein ACR2OI_07250 [Acidimicrobiia bacterium]